MHSSTLSNQTKATQRFGCWTCCLQVQCQSLPHTAAMCSISCVSGKCQMKWRWMNVFFYLPVLFLTIWKNVFLWTPRLFEIHGIFNIFEICWHMDWSALFAIYIFNIQFSQIMLHMQRYVVSCLWSYSLCVAGYLLLGSILISFCLLCFIVASLSDQQPFYWLLMQALLDLVQLFTHPITALFLTHLSVWWPYRPQRGISSPLICLLKGPYSLFTTVSDELSTSLLWKTGYLYPNTEVLPSGHRWQHIMSACPVLV